MLSFDHIGEGFQRALIGSRDGTATSTVIQQRINRLLQHALFIAHDDIRGVQIKQALETIITVNDPAI